MDSILSVQNENFTGSRKELAKVLGASQETKIRLHWQFPGIWQSWWRPIVESLHVNASPFKNKGIAERAVRRIKEGTILLQSGLDEN